MIFIGFHSLTGTRSKIDAPGGIFLARMSKRTSQEIAHPIATRLSDTENEIFIHKKYQRSIQICKKKKIRKVSLFKYQKSNLKFKNSKTDYY